MASSASFALALTLALTACSTTTIVEAPPGDPPAGEEQVEEEAPAASLEPYTEAEIQALFDKRCVKCHDATNSLLDLSAPFTRGTVGVATNTGGGPRGFCASSEHATRIVPGDREASLVWHKVKGTHDCGSEMPFDKGNKKLSATELERFGLWIDRLTRAD
ncbi:MAG: hypothetical protein KF795_24245 [Labilithrix sp.]|nr:hypothetical protein [Labilithrix sp.]